MRTKSSLKNVSSSPTAIKSTNKKLDTSKAKKSNISKPINQTPTINKKQKSENTRYQNHKKTKRIKLYAT